jgi:hypothetical protein
MFFIVLYLEVIFDMLLLLDGFNFLMDLFGLLEKLLVNILVL